MNTLRPTPFLFLISLLIACQPDPGQTPKAEETTPLVIAYYAGAPIDANAYEIGALDQIIHSFCHLQGNRLTIDSAEDTTGIRQLVELKKTHPRLKVLLSLGGWGGCETCSDVFATESGRAEFASSVKELSASFNTDGLDLDWEYPAIAGYPGHTFVPEDKHNFTLLVKALRDSLGPDFIISFAAGGFEKFLAESVEWDAVMPLVNNVNLMTYDLVSGASPVTGHHTPLYQTEKQINATDRAVRYLDSLGVPKSKMVIGAAFYARVWENVAPEENGRYQSGKFLRSVRYNQLDNFMAEHPGFELHWDSVAHAPYAYNSAEMLYATFDDPRSIAEKTEYVASQKLGGIMFWQLTGDKHPDGLVHTIYTTLHPQ
ncbi:MAG: glycoside hydrolase family 18 protein [Bacteroidia bacterium]